MKKNISLLLFLIYTSLNSNEIEKVLDLSENISIKNGFNIDQMPSAITILNEDEIKNSGAKTVKDLLLTLAGVDIFISNNGYEKLIFRNQISYKNSRLDKNKFFVDDIAINDFTHGGSQYYLDFPVELIEKIEIYRGPNSALYGNMATTGAINIITKKSSNEVFTTFGTNSNKMIGFINSIKSNNYDLKIDGYLSEDSQHQNNSFSIYAKKDSFYINSRIKTSKIDDELLFEDENIRSVFSNIGVKKYNRLGEYKFDLSLAIYSYEKQNELLYKNQNLLFSANQDIDLVKNNYIKFGFEYEKLNQLKNKSYAQDLGKNEISSLYFGDIFKLSNNIDLSLFLREDFIQEYNNEFSYQFGGVYRITDSFTTKAVYNSGYRLPLLRESQTDNIDLEEIKGFEWILGYSSAFQTTSFELNIFNYKISNPIVYTEATFDKTQNLLPSGTIELIDDFANTNITEDLKNISIFANSDDVLHVGMECLLKHKIDNKSNIYLSYSYVKSSYPVSYNKQDFDLSLKKVIYSYKVNTNLRFNTFIYSRSKIKEDEITTIPSYTKIDQNIVYSYNKNSTFELKINNLFDEKIYYSSQGKEQKKDALSTYFAYKYLF